MEFYIDDEQVEKQFQELFKEILQLRNGEVHSEMKKYGLNYSKALGASVINLKELAEKYEPNHLLAQKLWSKAFRESRIVATLLEQPEAMSELQLKRWVEESDSNEILEQLCMNLLVNLSDLENLLPNWMTSEDEKLILCATMIVGRLALIDKTRESRLFESFVSLLPACPRHTYLIKQLPRALGKIARRTDELKGLVFAQTQSLKDSDDKWLEIYEELMAEFPDEK